MSAENKVLSREVARIATNSNDGKDSEEPQKQSREEWRKKRELEEARKLGTAPAEVDEEGKDINPHIPQYISTVPWYVDKTQRASLKHQRVQPEKEKEFSSIDQWYKRGVSEKSIATKFRKGACTNCGAMTHKRKDCLERPRKVGAKYTGTNIAPDEHLQPNLQLDFDGKRDRWNGYNPEQHREVLEEYAKIQVAKQAVKAQKLQEELLTGKMEDTNDKEGGSEDEDKYADEADMPGTNFDSKRRITVRNLRIREDTAKYLRNLNPNSAYYDPKTRSMRENPYADSGKSVSELDYAGDNFVRYTGDTHSMAKTQMFAWDAEERGVDVHLQADPTRLEMLQKTFEVKKDDFKHTQRDSILEKYGGIEHLNAPPKELLLAQTEHYVEYNRHGTVVKGQEKAKAKSKYTEDNYINNHTSVWGSFWKNGSWGYACCHSVIKHSYCTGEAGKEIQSEKLTMPKLNKKETKLQQLEEKHSAWTRALGINQEAKPTEDDDQPSTSINKEDKEESGEESGEQSDEPKSLLQQHRDKLKEDRMEKKRQKKRDKKRKNKKRKKRQKQESSSSSSSSSDSDSDEPPEKRQMKKMVKEVEKEKMVTERKVKEAIDKEKKRVRKVEAMLKVDERKRPYNSMLDVKKPTDEEMEAYYRKKKNEDDPMAHLM
uniref:Pre-mRNA-splicing factor SLU7 n=1 Tax=Phallusia mammillata TaxID=59560 RepID=A0A6F9DTM9_9ASCI|nr:zinc finger protein (CCHC)-12 [Phallusia mammillata]